MKNEPLESGFRCLRDDLLNDSKPQLRVNRFLSYEPTTVGLLFLILLARMSSSITRARLSLFWVLSKFKLIFNLLDTRAFRVAQRFIICCNAIEKAVSWQKTLSMPEHEHVFDGCDSCVLKYRLSENWAHSLCKRLFSFSQKLVLSFHSWN